MAAAASEPRARARVGARRKQEVQEVEEGGWRPVTDRAGNEGTRSFHNHGEGPYKGLLLVEIGYSHIKEYTKTQCQSPMNSLCFQL